jgi:hypothetical protein
MPCCNSCVRRGGGVGRGGATQPQLLHCLGQSPLKLTLTHEEIAKISGTMRETVSYLFSEYKKKERLQIKGAALAIGDKPALEKKVHA